MTLEEQIRLHKQLSQKIEELEEQKKKLGQSIMQQMQSKTLIVGTLLVKKFSRLSYKVTIDEAKKYQATRMEEVVDKDKIKTLFLNGHAIPGVTQIEFIQVSGKL